MSLKKKLKKFLKKAAPIVAVVVAIVQPQLIPAIGKALGATSVAAQTALGSAAISGGTTALAGGSPEEILKSAAAGGAGGYAGVTAGEAVRAAQAAGTVGGGTVLPAAASGAAGSGAGTLVATGDVGKALGAAALGGVAGGGGELASSQAQQALPASAGRTTQSLVAGGAGGATEAAIRGENPLLGAVISAGGTAAQTARLDAEAERLARQEQAIAAFSQPRTPGVGTQLGQATAQNKPAGFASDQPFQSGDMTVTPTGQYAQDGVFPEVIVTAPAGEREAISYVSPTGLGRFTTPTRTQPGRQTPSQVSERDRQMMEITGLTRAPKPTEDIPETTRLGEVEVTGARDLERPITGETPTDEKLASQEFPLTEPSAADRRLINYLYGNMGAPMGAPYGGREMGAGTSALAQALSVGDPGALYLGKKGKERRPVWNVESLKLSDELGGTYG